MGVVSISTSLDCGHTVERSFDLVTFHEAEHVSQYSSMHGETWLVMVMVVVVVVGGGGGGEDIMIDTHVKLLIKDTLR